jgi:ubiquinone/menaquinone biosynthesis C-methylase UbiE
MPDREAALRKYRAHADSYDARYRLVTQESRRRNLARLALNELDTVIDAGCGTGFCFPMIEEMIGPAGRIVGIEQSAEMLKQARKQVDDQGWRNVMLIHAPVEDAIIPVNADAAIFYTTHDIMRTPRALENVTAHLRAGAKVLAVGIKWGPWWAVATNLRTLRMARQFCTTLEGMSRPWSHLERLLSELHVEQGTFRGFVGYVAFGRKGPICS